MITKGTFIGFLIASIIMIPLVFGLAKIFGHLSAPFVYTAGSIYMFKNFIFPEKNTLKGLKKMDEREKIIALRITSISTILFLLALSILSSMGDLSLWGYKINDIWGHISFPLFILIFSLVGFTILTLEEK